MKQYHQLTLLEREKVFVWYEAKVTIREIGRRLKRDPGTISRELKRNASGNGKNSRDYLVFRYIPSKAQKKAEKRALKQQKHPRMRKTMTIDRGPENSQHEQFTKQTQMPVYACNAYHSWEKGSVENGIGRLRFFIPKKSSVDQLTQKDLTRIETIMNNTPRKILGYLTPNEVYEKILNDSHTA